MNEQCEVVLPMVLVDDPELVMKEVIFELLWNNKVDGGSKDSPDRRRVTCKGLRIKTGYLGTRSNSGVSEAVRAYMCVCVCMCVCVGWRGDRLPSFLEGASLRNSK